VYEIKKRQDSKALLLLVDSADRIARYVGEVPAVAWDLVELTTKPLTIIYDGARNLASNLIAEDGSVGIRVTNEEFSKALCYAFRKPIISTSANISGNPTPQNFYEIEEEIKQGVDYVAEARREEDEKKSPSSIIKFEKNGTFVVLRK
jgi:L-threonylcarbamoyladenylate synthase